MFFHKVLIPGTTVLFQELSKTAIEIRDYGSGVSKVPFPEGSLEFYKCFSVISMLSSPRPYLGQQGGYQPGNQKKMQAEKIAGSLREQIRCIGPLVFHPF